MKINQNVAVAAPVGGFLLGFLDFVWIKYVPYPFAQLGNSLAVWAVAAFVLTFRSRWRPVPAIVAAIVLLVVAVPSYYLAAALIQHDDFANMYNTVAMLWMAFAVVAGVVFGGAGVVARTPGRWRGVAFAVPVAVMFAEAVLHARRIGADGRGIEPLWPALIDVALGLLIAVVAADTRRRRLSAVLLAVPLAGAGFALLSLARVG